MPDEVPPPIEVELHRDIIRLKVNKTALKAAARFHSLVKRQQSEKSIKPEDSIALMALSHAPSRVHFKDDFTDLCSEVLNEEPEEEDILKSWAVLNYNSVNPLTPPTSNVSNSPIHFSAATDTLNLGNDMEDVGNGAADAGHDETDAGHDTAGLVSNSSV